MKRHHHHRHSDTRYLMTPKARLDEAGSLCGGRIVYHLEGATLKNVVFNNDGVRNGTEQCFPGVSGQKEPAPVHYTDEQVARAISVLNGKKKPLNEKQLFLGIIKVLQSKCGWSQSIPECCRHINTLPGADCWEFACEENNLKAPRALRFANRDYEEWEDYVPTAAEKQIFWKTKTAADYFLKQLKSSVSE